MHSDLRVAAISVENKPNDLAGNLARIEDWSRKAALEGASLVLFPELSLTGFIPNHPLTDHADWLRRALVAARRMALRLDGPVTAELTRIAQHTGVAIAAGLLEDAGNRMYNTTVLVDENGVIRAWRKLHIPMFELPFYVGGPAPRPANFGDTRLGVNICFDAFLPESTRLLAVQNVDLVLFPFAADPPPGDAAAWAKWARPVLQARCMENGVFGVACNYSGFVECEGVTQSFPGGAMIVGPEGEVLAEQLSPNSMLVATLPAERLRLARSSPDYLFRFRRPGIYGLLSSDEVG